MFEKSTNYLKNGFGSCNWANRLSVWAKGLRIWLLDKTSFYLTTFDCDRNATMPFCCAKDGYVIHNLKVILHDFILVFTFLCSLKNQLLI